MRDGNPVDPVDPPVDPEDPPVEEEPTIAVTVTKVLELGEDLYVTAEIVVGKLPNADKYILHYDLAGDAKGQTDLTDLDTNNPPMFRFTEYVKIQIFDVDGKLLHTFNNVKLTRP